LIVSLNTLLSFQEMKGRRLRKKRNKKSTILSSDTEESEEDSSRQRLETKEKSLLHITRSGRPVKRKARLSKGVSGGKENLELFGTALDEEPSSVVVNGRQCFVNKKEPNSEVCSSLDQPNSKWLSTRRGRPILRQKLLKFVYDKKRRNGTDMTASPVASAEDRNSCSVVDTGHQRLMPPVISGETPTPESSWPVMAWDSPSAESPDESDVEWDSDSSDPIFHSNHQCLPCRMPPVSNAKNHQMPPVILEETPTSEASWPVLAWDSMSTESPDESDVELDSDSSEPISHSNHRKGKTRVMVDCESSEENDSVSANSCSPSSVGNDGTQELGSSDNSMYPEEQREKVLSFLNKNSVEELSEVSGLTEVKAKLLNDLRPFQNLKELVGFSSSGKIILWVPSHILTIFCGWHIWG